MRRKQFMNFLLLLSISLVIISSGCLEETIQKSKEIGGDIASQFGFCGGNVHIIKLDSDGFKSSKGASISEYEISKGDTVTFKNVDETTHTLEINKLGISKTIEPEEDSEITIDKVDEYKVEYEGGSLTLISTQIAPSWICGE